MLPLQYVKVPPTTQLLVFSKGRIVANGSGLATLVWRHSSTVVFVPLATKDVPFVFTTETSDFQTITFQGQLTYKVVKPDLLASALDFSVDFQGNYVSEDPQKLSERLALLAQTVTRSLVASENLRDALSNGQLAYRVREALAVHSAVVSLGVDVLSLSLLSAKPTQEMARALEAQVREQVLREADAASYARRKAAVEEERAIKEAELATQLAVEARKREIREQQVAADISVEQKRAELMSAKVANERMESESKAYALRAQLEPLQGVDWKVLTAATSGNDPKLTLALAFRELAENASKIGTLSITPELLASLAQK